MSIVLEAARILGAVEADIPGLWNVPGYPELTTNQLIEVSGLAVRVAFIVGGDAAYIAAQLAGALRTERADDIIVIDSIEGPTQAPIHIMDVQDIRPYTPVIIDQTHPTSPAKSERARGRHRRR